MKRNAALRFTPFGPSSTLPSVVSSGRTDLRPKGLMVEGRAVSPSNMMKTKSQIAAEKMTEGFNCAQSIFYAHCEDLQFEKDLALKIASGFGAGMGRKGEVCGAVSGGIIILGIKYGSAEEKNQLAKETTYRKTQKLMDQFKERHGTYICRDLLRGCDLMTKQGQRDFKNNDLFNRTCKPCVESVVEILDKIMS